MVKRRRQSYHSENISKRLKKETIDKETIDVDNLSNNRENAFLSSKASYKYKKSINKLKSNGYEPFAFCDIISLSKNKYRPTIFINRDDKKVLIANVGTNFTRIGLKSFQISDYYNIAIGEIPKKFDNLSKINDELIKELGGEWEFEYTGHGVGGALSHMQAIDMKSKLDQSNISVKVFDVPIYTKSLEKISNGNKLDVKCEIFQAKSNFLNGFGGGDDKILMIMFLCMK